MLSDDEARELTTLRARAYGPVADLDAVSAERLRALEAAERASATVREEQEAPPDAPEPQPADAEAGPGPAADPAPDAPRTPTVDARGGRMPGWRRTLVAMAAAAVVLGAFAAGQVVEQARTPAPHAAAGWHTDIRALPPLAQRSYERVSTTRAGWDEGSLYFVGAATGRFVWLATQGDGATTCIIVDADTAADDGFSGRACAATADVRGSSIGYATIDSSADEPVVDRYTVQLGENSAPVLIYSHGTGAKN